MNSSRILVTSSRLPESSTQSGYLQLTLSSRDVEELVAERRLRAHRAVLYAGDRLA